MAIETLYSRGIFPDIARVLVPLTNALPFSLAALLLVALPVVFIVTLVKSFKRLSFQTWLIRSLGRTFTASLILYALFVLTWGANYERASVETQFNLSPPNLSPRSVSQNDVAELTRDLQRMLERHQSADPNIDNALSAVRRELLSLNFEATGVRPTLPQDVKRLPAGSLILSGGASGVVSPWTLEPHIDAALSATDQVAVGAHELAHILGYAGEADADFIGALAGLNALDDFANYATALRLWSSANWQLPADVARANYNRLPEKVKQDYEAMLAPYRRYRLPEPLRNAQRDIYDRYLKTQGVTSGVKDYSRVVDLLVLAREKGLVLGD